jgi:Tol biopolymer transport system component
LSASRFTLVALLTALAVAAPASASFPGRNGKLVATTFGCGTRHIAVVERARLTPLTPRCEPVAGYESVYRDTFVPEWLPDGRRLLFAEAAPGFSSPHSTIITADPAGGAEQRGAQMSLDIRENPIGPSVGPDGRRMVFGDRGGIVTTDLDGGNRHDLVADPQCTNSDGSPRPCSALVDPRWSPDGRYIAVHRVTGYENSKIGIWLLSARTGSLLRKIAPRGYDVDWSPDSRRIVFSSMWGHSGGDGNRVKGGNLYVARADGGGVRRVVRGHGTAETKPVWSPDGRWLAWISLKIGPGDIDFTVTPTVFRRRVSGGRWQKVAVIPGPRVEEGFYDKPDLAWQPLP